MYNLSCWNKPVHCDTEGHIHLLWSPFLHVTSHLSGSRGRRLGCFVSEQKGSGASSPSGLPHCMILSQPNSTLEPASLSKMNGLVLVVILVTGISGLLQSVSVIWYNEMQGSGTSWPRCQQVRKRSCPRLWGIFHWLKETQTCPHKQLTKEQPPKQDRRKEAAGINGQIFKVLWRDS